MKARLSIGKNLKTTATPEVSVIKKGGGIAVLRIEIELLKTAADVKDDGDYTPESDEPKYRDAAMGELLTFNLKSVAVSRIAPNDNSSELSISGVLGTKVPHTPGG